MIDTRISISRVTSSVEDDFIQITITDYTSGIPIWKGEMSLENFAKCVTGYSSIKIKNDYLVDIKNIAHIGKERKTKTVFLKNMYVNSIKPLQEKIESEFIKQFPEEIKDGWFIYHDGLNIHQNWSQWKIIIAKYE